MRFAVLIVFVLSQSGAARAAALSPLAEEFAKNPKSARLPDFSYAGYRAGSALPPRVDGPVFNVTEFGAIPNDGKDDVDAIQKAVDAAVAKGGGVVLFPKGVFDFDVSVRMRNVKVRGSFIVLRGSGSGPDGTVLHDHQFSDTPVKGQKWMANAIPSFIQAGIADAEKTNRNGYMPPTTLATAVSPAPRGSTVIEVATPASVKAGETYLLTMTDPDNSLFRELAKPMVPGKGAIGAGHLATNVQKFRQMVIVEKVDGKKLTLHAPVLWELKEVWKPELYAMPVIREVGIENFRFRTNWKGPFKHHLNAEHDDGWNHIRFDGVRDGWVRDCVHEGTTAAVMWACALNCVAYNCRIEGPQGHNGYTVIGASTYNLLLDCDAGKNFHSFQLQGHVSGNVFLRPKGGNGMDCHGGLGVYNLYDNPNMGTQHGGAANSTPPRIGFGLTLWNWQPKVLADAAIPSPIIEGGNGKTVEPGSIYEYQRNLRLKAFKAEELPAAQWRKEVSK